MRNTTLEAEVEIAVYNANNALVASNSAGGAGSSLSTSVEYPEEDIKKVEVSVTNNDSFDGNGYDVVETPKVPIRSSHNHTF